MNKHLIRGSVIGLLSVLLSLLIWKSGLIDKFETATWDTRVKLLAEPSNVSDKIVMILVDQESLDWGENELGWSWPWPRQVLAPIIDYISQYGAKSIAFDVLYTESSIYGVEDDEMFSSSISSSDKFIGSVYLKNDEKNRWDNSIPEQITDIKGMDRWLLNSNTNSKIYSQILLPIPEVYSSAKLLANVQAEPESDGVYRKGNLFSIYNDRIIPSLALASYLVGNKDKSRLSIDLKNLNINDLNVPINSSGETILRFRPSDSYTKLKAAALFESILQEAEGGKALIDPEIFKDSYIFFGYSAAGLLDLRPTPVSPVTPGVEVHATMLDNLLSEDFIQEFPVMLSVLTALLLSLLAAILLTKFQGPGKGVIFFILFFTLPIPVSILSYSAGFWFPLVFIELSIVISLSAAGAVNYATEGKQKRYIKQAFKQYLSPDFIENLISSPDKLKLGGEKKEISIFFSDLQGFTTISEGLNPEELTNLLNDYLTAMTDIILEEGGTIDKYEGDAIIAFWNAPIDYEDHAQRAVRAALRCQKKLMEMRPEFKDRTGYDLYMRIGLNTGFAVVGNLGSHTRFDYTMLGDSVNLAARLEGINKQYGTYTMISKSTHDAINGLYPCRELSKVAVVGKNEAIIVYEPMLEADYEKNKNTYKIFQNGLFKFYDGDFDKAIEEFNKIKDVDPASVKYIAKCNELLKSDVKQWDGVWKMTQK